MRLSQRQSLKVGLLLSVRGASRVREGPRGRQRAHLDHAVYSVRPGMFAALARFAGSACSGPERVSSTGSWTAAAAERQGATVLSRWRRRAVDATWHVLRLQTASSGQLAEAHFPTQEAEDECEGHWRGTLKIVWRLRLATEALLRNSRRSSATTHLLASLTVSLRFRRGLPIREPCAMVWRLWGMVHRDLRAAAGLLPLASAQLNVEPRLNGKFYVLMPKRVSGPFLFLASRRA